MARLTMGQKAERVLQLLLGLRKNRVAAALVAHGFSDEDLAEGWRLLQRVTRTRLGFLVQLGTADAGLITKIDEWENQWFPIADATLKRRFPGVHAWMFRNLTQTEGPAVLVSVGTFVERWDSLSKSNDKGGPEADGDEAKKILIKRGLTKAVIEQARQLIATASKLEEPGENAGSPLEEDEDFAQAETDLWAWYREWSTIAQSAIKSRRLLKDLGFRQTTTKAGQPEEVGEENGADEQDAAEENAPPAPGAGRGNPNEG